MVIKMYQEISKRVVWMRKGGKGWGQTDLLGVKEAERELTVLLRRKINHFSLTYKVVLVGPQQTLDAFTTLPQKHFSGLGCKQWFYTGRAMLFTLQGQGKGGGRRESLKTSTHLNMIQL